MKQCIRIGIRHNLFYLLMLILFNFLRNVDLIALDKVFKFNTSMIFVILMFFGEFFAGLIIYIYQNNFCEKIIIFQNLNIYLKHWNYFLVVF